MIEHSPTIGALMTAMHSVQGAVSGVAKDSKNPHFKNSYASLEAVVDAIRQPCQMAGLVVLQAPGEIANNCISVSTMIAHAKSGEWIRSTLQLPMAKTDPQGAGSALTYAERYSLMAMFNLPPVDDDGESAVDRSRNYAAPATNGNGHAPADTDKRIADDLRKRIATAKTNPEIDRVINDPDVIRSFQNLPPVLQKTVTKAVGDRRDQIADLTVAG
jgi:hypothetical protein